MKKIMLLSVVTGFSLFAGSAVVSAQDEQMLVIPVELFTCNYNDGKGPGDLDKAVDKWNAWADSTGMDDYAAWTLTPYYFGPKQEFDVIWLGAGKDAVALGKAQDAYLQQSDLHDAFTEAVTCDAHVNFASINHKAPPKGETPKNSVITFSDCSVKEGASFEALGTAMGEWTAHLDNAGSAAGIWHWYPAYGGGGEEFSFKWIQSYKNFADLGKDYESYGNGRGYEVNGRLFGELLDCDSSRAYIAQSRRFAQLR